MLPPQQEEELGLLLGGTKEGTKTGTKETPGDETITQLRNHSTSCEHPAQHGVGHATLLMPTPD